MKIIALVALWVVLVGAAYAHDGVVARCFGSSHPALISSQKNANGTLSETYDRNGDGKLDIEVISTTRNGDQGDEHNPHALLFVVDQNYDGDPDVVLIDPVGVGACRDLFVYAVLGHADDETQRSLNQGGRINQ